ncbi:MAG TPA: trypsin-like peptidase domain-containing protein [Dehalococcoidia bacterium]|nr:trypsin-like peptidase domain-containing protein [Dehalococcoidia bacterium]MDP6272718.1 trypsin-like peptidase domain-containing protein [Dehalococcoidia bacterium]MDP7213723.1 trypsin-like peptidase domain-containing protein [Dehalococcoidia bacterium]MDP7513665.1 trypsin-like peptidase domain-containing protein [Dehalococcoidia bacterium]HJM53795.1 trypsin-like peptidase domain-containing protein [Dehalococcoidia bacterium]
MLWRRLPELSGWRFLLLGIAGTAIALVACSSPAINPPTVLPAPQPTPQPTATPQPTPTPIAMPRTPTPVIIPPTSTPFTLPPTPTPITFPTPFPTSTPLLSTADLVEAVAPSVVHIGVTTANDTATGTGIVFGDGGLVMTNRHVVQDGLEIRVSLSDGQVLTGEIVGLDSSIDIAVVRVNTDDLLIAALGDSDAVRVGEDVVAIGHALDLPGGPTVSKGVVSALDRSIVDGSEVLSDLIQTDAAINLGNSGGPLLNARGEVIGINTAKIPTGDGIGFAIGINIAHDVALRLVAQSSVQAGFVGIEPLDITPTLADQLSLPVLRGVGVLRVVPGSPADGVLQVDDVIIQLDGVAIPDTLALEQFLRSHPAGEVVEITYYRASAGLLTDSLTLGERPG